MDVFNLSTDAWDHTGDRPGWHAKAAWVGKQLSAELIGGCLYELEPGNKLWPYHTHHANEEWLLVGAEDVPLAVELRACGPGVMIRA